MPTFTYEFEELPLAVVNGIEAGFVNGTAEIQYSNNGGWVIWDITLEGFGERVNGKRQWPQVSAPIEIRSIISHRLFNEWREKVQDAVADAIADDRERAADDYADMRREERMAAE
jgi:hypothetical protein